MQKASTFFPQDFHRISTNENTRKAFTVVGYLEFSTILAFPNFLNFYVDKYISLTFINFCLDKGVHFNRKKQKSLGCTPGKLYVNGQYFCRTLEKPFRGAERNISSIHPGIYRAHLRYVDNKRQWRIQIQPIITRGYGDDSFIANRIIKRDGIQIHSGTKPEHSRGCILVGLPGSHPCELSSSDETFNRLLDEYFGSRYHPNQNIKIVVTIQTDYRNP